ncbi:hypothetical protein EDEG_02854 [Edhazardia aedis USNM 41457]|uniref:Glucose-6-phosphate 1-dehydrogenase n=1 Tax=Edhazardia aedis (strain USNM 41457) TaxID=1003232 RepID=J9D4M7_EDHAE|nr:hypothetical protein EDEG_02854 [Edhazardia aedis USNM 41457]|eukprot:EJW02761.1 hypothetical protein EDEG_02854 [Edhazardia aedis USNM 41457]
MIIVIFGASGDLAKRKLFPSLSKLNLPNTQIIAYSRSKTTIFDQENATFYSRIKYIEGSYDNLQPLFAYKNEEILFYFAVPPKIYKTLLNQIQFFEKGVLALEKPFGDNLADINEIFNFQKANFSRFCVVFIDHYLLKPLISAIPVFKIKYPLLFKYCSAGFAESVVVISKEILGSEGRLYFDETGIVKDIIQNHLLAFFCSIFYDHSNSKNYMSSEKGNCNEFGDSFDITKTNKDLYKPLIDYNLIGEKRFEVFNNLKIKKEKCLFGQYDDYESELGSKSNTETYAFIEGTYLNTVKTVFIAGKGLNEKLTELRVNLKHEFIKQFLQNISTYLKNQNNSNYKLNDSLINETVKLHIVFNIAPHNKIFLHLLTKNDEEITLPIILTDEILNENKYVTGGLEDHALIFNSLVNKQPFSATSLMEVKKQWEEFDILDCKNESNIFKYKKGIDFPTEIVDYMSYFI